MQKTPFIRFRYGTPLEIDTNIQQSIKYFIAQYQKEGEVAFKTLIKDIADGSGWGIHPSSTWYRAIFELFDIYRDWKGPSRQEVFNKIIKILETLTLGTNPEILWGKASKLISRNIEILSCWQYSHIKRFCEEEHLVRDTDGSYYKEENGRKIEVIGTKSLKENMFGYIEDSINRDYGYISMFLKFIEELFIALDYQKNPNHYHKHLQYILNESDTSTWFLHGQWRVNSAYEYVPLAWYPRSCYCNISWLRAETTALLAKKCQVDKGVMPKLPTNDNALLQFQEAFKGYPLQYEVSLETNVLLGSKPFGQTPPEVYVVKYPFL